MTDIRLHRGLANAVSLPPQGAFYHKGIGDLHLSRTDLPFERGLSVAATLDLSAIATEGDSSPTD